jgi:hypothetical protein
MTDERTETPAEPHERRPDDQDSLHLGRFLPAGMVLGAVVGAILGAVTHRLGVLLPVGIAAGILLSGVLPVFWRRR